MIAEQFKALMRLILRKQFRLVILLISMAMCCAASAQQESNLKPGDINLEFSKVFIFVDKSTALGHQHAVAGKLKSGHLFASDPKASSFVFDMQSFDADTSIARKYFGLEGETDESTQKKVNENMRGEDVLDVEHYPEARLDNITLKKTEKLNDKNEPEYLMEGDFTLHDVKKHITAKCHVEAANGWQHVRGAFKILQSDYGIRPFSKMLGAIGVKDELKIVGEIWVVPSP